MIDTVGSADTFERAMVLVRHGGRIVRVGVLLRQAPGDAGTGLVVDEIEVMGSRFASRGRWPCACPWWPGDAFDRSSAWFGRTTWP